MNDNVQTYKVYRVTSERLKRIVADYLESTGIEDVRPASIYFKTDSAGTTWATYQIECKPH